MDFFDGILGGTVGSWLEFFVQNVSVSYHLASLISLFQIVSFGVYKYVKILYLSIPSAWHITSTVEDTWILLLVSFYMNQSDSQ